jgi:hypothetical protein
MRYNRGISLFLGISMFTFGFLKFFQPFKGWYAIQISASQLGETSYALGIAGELAVGLTLLALVKFYHSISSQQYFTLTVFASAAVIVMMGTGTYVHLHPGVPAEVLPLKIKPPYIPLSFLGAATINIILIWKNRLLMNRG